MKTLEEQYVSLCRNAAFEEVLLSHPYIQVCGLAMWMNQPLSIDCNGLAQHYGLPTTLLDTTNSFEVASFFATCESQLDGSWHPVIESEYPGVIYRFFPYQYIDPGRRPFYKDVGWQPLHRPAQQKAAAIDLGCGQSLEGLWGVEAHLFRHDAKISLRIWSKSQEGNSYFPPDAAEEMAREAKVLMRFTTAQMTMSHTRLQERIGPGNIMIDPLSLARRSGICVSSAPVLSWDGYPIERDRTKLMERLESELESVRYRMVAPLYVESS